VLLLATAGPLAARVVDPVVRAGLERRAGRVAERRAAPPPAT